MVNLFGEDHHAAHMERPGATLVAPGLATSYG